jgi:hypothetical protein
LKKEKEEEEEEEVVVVVVRGTWDSERVLVSVLSHVLCELL